MARQGLTSSDVELAGGSRLPTECGPCFLGEKDKRDQYIFEIPWMEVEPSDETAQLLCQQYQYFTDVLCREMCSDCSVRDGHADFDVKIGVYVVTMDTHDDSLKCILQSLALFNSWFTTALSSESTLMLYPIVSEAASDEENFDLIQLFKEHLPHDKFGIVLGYNRLLDAYVDRACCTSNLHGDLGFDRDVWVQTRLSLDQYKIDTLSVQKNAVQRLEELRAAGVPTHATHSAYAREIVKLRLPENCNYGLWLLDTLGGTPSDNIQVAVRKSEQQQAAINCLLGCLSTLTELRSAFAKAHGLGEDGELIERHDISAESGASEVALAECAAEIHEISRELLESSSKLLEEQYRDQGHLLLTCQSRIENVKDFRFGKFKEYEARSDGVFAKLLEMKHDTGVSLQQEAIELKSLVSDLRERVDACQHRLETAEQFHLLLNKITEWQVCCLEAVQKYQDELTHGSQSLLFIKDWAVQNIGCQTDRLSKLKVLSKKLSTENRFFKAEYERVTKSVWHADAQLDALQASVLNKTSDTCSTRPADAQLDSAYIAVHPDRAQSDAGGAESCQSEAESRPWSIESSGGLMHGGDTEAFEKPHSYSWQVMSGVLSNLARFSLSRSTTPTLSENHGVPALQISAGEANAGLEEISEEDVTFVNVWKEMVDTEVAYTDALEECIQTYGHYFKSRRRSEAQDMPATLRGRCTSFCGDLRDILRFSKEKLLPAFKRHRDDPYAAGHIFIALENNFDVYSEYFRHNNTRNEMLQDHDAYLKRVQVLLGVQLPLNAYVLRVFQRMIQYREILKRMLHKFPPSKTKEQPYEELQLAEWVVSFYLQHGNSLQALDRLKGMSTNVSTLGMLLRTEAFYVTTSQQRWFKFAQLCTVFLFEEAIVWAVRVPHESKMTCYDEFQYSGMQRIIDVTVRSPPGKADTIELTIDKGRYILLKAVDPPMKEVFLNDIHALILGCYAELRARQRRKASYSQPVTLNAPFGVRGHRMRLKDWSHMSRRSITSVSSVEESASPSPGCCIPRFFPSPGIMNSLASDRLAGHNHSEPHTGSCGICRDLLPELTGQTSDNSDQSDTREVDDVANSDDELR